MAKRGIRIPFVAEIKEFIKGTDDIEGALDDVGDALDGVAKDAQKQERKTEKALEGTTDAAEDAADALEDIGDAAKDGGRKAERAMDDTADAVEDVGDGAKDAERDLEKSFREISRAADKAGDDLEDVGRSAKRGFDKVEDESEQAGQVVADEARQSSAELGSSFDGSFESIVDGFRDVASSAGAELGGLAGYIAGFGTAAGIGLVTKVIEGIREREAKLRERANTLFEGYIEAAEEAGISAGKALDRGLLSEAVRKDLLMERLGVDNIADAFVEVARLSRALGVDADVIYNTISGTPADTAAGMADVEASLDAIIAKGKAERGEAGAAAEVAVTAANKLRDVTGTKAQEEERASLAARTAATATFDQATAEEAITDYQERRDALRMEAKARLEADAAVETAESRLEAAKEAESEAESDAAKARARERVEAAEQALEVAKGKVATQTEREADAAERVADAQERAAEWAQRVADYARNTAGYWQDTERAVVGAGLALPGQVRAERTYNDGRP